jgi:hypothetical protein
MKAMSNLIWIFSLLQFVTGCSQRPEPETYLIPYGFKGKVNVIFNQPKGAAVKYDNGRRLYEIPPSGILLTQFKNEEGIINHEFYYIDSIGKRTQLKILSDNEKNDIGDAVGVYRDGTVGVIGNSNDSKSLLYQEFYVTNGREFEDYFTPQYQKQFNDKVKQITGYAF